MYVHAFQDDLFKIFVKNGNFELFFLTTGAFRLEGNGGGVGGGNGGAIGGGAGGCDRADAEAVNVIDDPVAALLLDECEILDGNGVALAVVAGSCG